MTDIIPDKDVLELALQLARIYSDEGFRTRVENDELKQAGGEGEILLQFEPEKLREAEVLLFQLHRWVNGRERRARERQDAKTATALGLPVADLARLRSDLQLHGEVHHPGEPVDIRPDQLTPAFAAAMQNEVLLQGHG